MKQYATYLTTLHRLMRRTTQGELVVAATARQRYTAPQLSNRASGLKKNDPTPATSS
jgi:hypothetical protein